jgi:DNA-binding NtrC family response regulator
MAIASFLVSERMQYAADAIARAARSTDGVLICGEAGTGKEIVARAIHRAAGELDRHSLEDLLRCGREGGEGHAPFVAVECGARDVERVVFGAPAATNGDEDLDRISSEGLLFQAFGGTMFLRSVQDMPGRLQARLARVLRDKEVWVQDGGGVRTLSNVNVRAIASIDASSTDEHDDRVVPELWKKLAAHRIELPPIRQRREDIPGLIRMLLADVCEALQIPSKTASSQAVALMSALPWRGNFTEMRGLLRTLVLKSPGRLIRLGDVLENIRLDGTASNFTGGGTLREARDRFEREYVSAVLEQHHGRMAEAARVLGIQRTNLYRKVRQLSVERRRPGRMADFGQ